ncbi:uncharacterized protein LOC142295374 [Anomaloglossus baeobatrachus]|uniref:uncharacterized protein LOC142295374 n=1 Tax=Anomaloglossus baeobatrachus TaxID=238106 RepID=UPI003F4F6E1B
MNRSVAPTFPILDKSDLFMHLPSDPQNANRMYLQCPATGHVYCMSTGTLHRKMMQIIRIPTNILSLNHEKVSPLLPSSSAAPSTMKTSTVKAKNTDEQQNGDSNLTYESNTTQHIQSNNPSIISNVSCNKNLNAKKADQPVQGSSASIKTNTKKEKERTSKNKTDSSAQDNSLLQSANKFSTNLQGSCDPVKKKKEKKCTRKAKDKSVPLEENSSTISKTKFVSSKRKKSTVNVKPMSSTIANTPPVILKSPASTTQSTKRCEKKIQRKKAQAQDSKNDWAFLQPFQRRPYPHHHRKKSLVSSECKNCIMASAVHEIIHSRFAKNTNELMPVSQIRAMLSTGDCKLRNRSEWIQKMEEEAIHKYKKMNLEKHKQRLKVKEYEVLHHKEKFWLACSSRRAINRKDEKSWPLVVKCLDKYPDCKLRQASEHHSFCLRWNGTSYTLQMDHAYYTQMQCHMAIAESPYAELVVHTRKETTILPVYFDFEFWKQTEATLETFFTKNILPYMKMNDIEPNPVSAPLELEKSNDVIEE